MEIDQLFDIPAHPLLVHVPVVFTPLAALGAVVIVARASWRRRFGWLVVAFAALAAIGMQLATWSGEGLEERIDPNDAVEQHIDLAETARPLVFVFFALVTAYVVVADRLERRRPAMATVGAGSVGSPRPARSADVAKPVLLVLGALTVISAVTATVWSVRTGHQGADAVWRGTGEVDGG